MPQCSNLGPILFLIHVNDFSEVSSQFESVLFAVDTALGISNFNYDSAISSLNIELEKVRQWIFANRLTINVDKTNAFIFSNKLLSNTVPIRIGNEMVHLAQSCKYLRIHLDNKLNFSDHISYVTGKLAKSIGILFKIRSNLPTSARLNYYYSYVYPYLSYNVYDR